MKKTIYILIFVVIMFGCSNNKVTKTESFRLRYEKGVELIEKEKYFQAVDHFTFVIYNSPGSEIADDAQFYLAECHYHLKEYLIAIDEYDRLLRRWPSSSFSEEAKFKIGKTFEELSPIYERDQSNTNNAITAYQSFIDQYPESKFRKDAEKSIKKMRYKLAMKIYDAGKLYMVLREWKAAIITFQTIIEEYYDTKIIDNTYLEMSSCYNKMNDKSNMIKSLNEIDAKKILTAKDKIRYRTLMDKIK